MWRSSRLTGDISGLLRHRRVVARMHESAVVTLGRQRQMRLKRNVEHQERRRVRLLKQVLLKEPLLLGPRNAFWGTAHSARKGD